MSGWLSLLLISIAISLDGLGVGMTYGMRKLRIPLFSLVVIACCSFAVVCTVMTIGNSLSAWLTPEVSKKIGAAVLILIGCFTLWRLWKKDPAPTEPESAETPITQIHLFGLIIQILRDPERADADKSGHIVGWEAVMLGLALSLDAFGAGISLTLLGYAPLLVSSCVAITSAALLSVGVLIGRKADTFGWFSRFTWLPPLLLICIGIVKAVW